MKLNPTQYLSYNLNGNNIYEILDYDIHCIVCVMVFLENAQFRAYGLLLGVDGKIWALPIQKLKSMSPAQVPHM